MSHAAYFQIGMLLMLMIPVGGCELIDGVEESDAIREVYTISHSCFSTRSSLAPLAWFVTADTLHVSLLFDSNCCAEYEKKIITSYRTIFISLEDSTRPVCRCDCHYEETFGFVIGENRQIRIRATVKRHPEAKLEVLADSTIHLDR